MASVTDRPDPFSIVRDEPAGTAAVVGMFSFRSPPAVMLFTTVRGSIQDP